MVICVKKTTQFAKFADEKQNYPCENEKNFVTLQKNQTP